MGTIVIHAGMPKAGSSSVQAWLRANASTLLERHDTRLVAAVPDESRERVRVEPRVDRDIKSHGVAQLMRRGGAPPKGLVEALDDVARRHRTVVLTGEGLAHLFSPAHAGFLANLEALAKLHPVRVAYYVRPQHSALESAWKQWGFRSGRSPSDYLSERAASLHYFETYGEVARLAPTLRFEPRPFVRELLEGGSVPVDFSRRFLVLAADELREGAETWANPSLPLELANLLQAAPKGLLWRHEHDNERLNTVKRLVSGLEPQEDERTRASRRVLQGYCHERFEEGNQALMRSLGWKAASFVPHPTPPIERPELEALDDLWAPRASDAELALLWRALSAAMDNSGQGATDATGRRRRRRKLDLGVILRLKRPPGGARLRAPALGRRRTS